MGTSILTCEEVRRCEALAVAGGLSMAELMRRAGEACAQALMRLFPTGRVLVLCGPGNNGGDGFGVAARLRAAGVDVQVAAMALPQTQPAADFAAQWAGPMVPFADAMPDGLIIDALFGTGLARLLPAEVQALLSRST